MFFLKACGRTIITFVFYKYYTRIQLKCQYKIKKSHRRDVTFFMVTRMGFEPMDASVRGW